MVILYRNLPQLSKLHHYRTKGSIFTKTETVRQPQCSYRGVKLLSCGAGEGDHRASTHTVVPAHCGAAGSCGDRGGTILTLQTEHKYDTAALNNLPTAHSNLNVVS